MTSRDSLGMLGAQLLDLDILTPENAAHMLDLGLRVARPSDTRVTDDPDHAARIARAVRRAATGAANHRSAAEREPAPAAGRDGPRPGR